MANYSIIVYDIYYIYKACIALFYVRDMSTFEVNLLIRICINHTKREKEK